MHSFFWQEVLSYPSPRVALSIVGRCAAVYVFVSLGLRALGKRELGQMNVYDLVLVIVIANAVQNAMVGDDNTLFGGLIAAATLLLMNRAFVVLLRGRRGKLLLGEPIVLFEHGRLDERAMRGEGVSEEQIMEALREHGLERLSEARKAVLEVDGSISIIPREPAGAGPKRRFKGLRNP